MISRQAPGPIPKFLSLGTHCLLPLLVECPVLADCVVSFERSFGLGDFQVKPYAVIEKYRILEKEGGFMSQPVESTPLPIRFVTG